MVQGSVKVYKKRYKKNKFGNKKTMKFKKLNCSTSVKNKNYTCYSDTELYKLRDIWNARHPDRPIKTKKTKDIWNKLKEYYATICNKESCWVKRPLICKSIGRPPKSSPPGQLIKAWP